MSFSNMSDIVMNSQPKLATYLESLTAALFHGRAAAATEGTSVLPLSTAQLAFYSVLCVIGWAIVTLVLLKATGRSHEYVSRVVSLIHACVAVTVCTIAMHKHMVSVVASGLMPANPDALIGGGALQEGYTLGGPHLYCQQGTDWEFAGIIVTFGYLALDAIGMWLSANHYDIVFVLHHVIGMAACLVPMYLKTHTYDIVLCTLVLELSNPSMHLHWLLVEDFPASLSPEGKTHHFHGGVLQTLCRWTFYVLFIGGRLGLAFIAMKDFIVNPGCGLWIHIFIGSCFMTGSAHFVYQLAGKLWRGDMWR